MTNTIKKTALTLAGLAALGFAGAQLANATSSTTPAAALQAPDGGDRSGDQRGEASETVTGPAATRAKAAALAEVPGGTVTQLRAEQTDDDGEHAHKPEAGDEPDGAETDAPEEGDHADPAYESQIAYDVEVTAGDGTITDVHLDKAFAVLGTEGEGKERAGE